MTKFLIDKTESENTTRSESCYGPNCDAEPILCLDLTTGGLTSVLLIGFLWADVVNTISLFWAAFCCNSIYCKYRCCGGDDNEDDKRECCSTGWTAFKSCFILAELS